MDIWQFIYGLFRKHLTIPVSQISQLENEARAWQDSSKVANSKVGLYVKEHGEAWYTRTILAIAFIFASRWMYNFMNPDLEGGDENEE